MLTVINYHYIREDFFSNYPSIFGMTPSQFKMQLIMLNDIGEFISPKELIKNINDILKSKQNYLLVTFDDGLREQFELAKPILERLNISALFFINSINYIENEVSLVHKIHLLRSQFPSSFLLETFEDSDFNSCVSLTSAEEEKAIAHYNYDDTNSAYLKYILNFKLSVSQKSTVINDLFGQFFDSNKIVEELYMTKEQLIILANQGMLGSHTHSHLALGLLKPTLIHSELTKTKDYLEQLTNSTISCVSYPYGSYEACANPVPELASLVGHTIGFTMERGINSISENKLLLKRFDCNDLPGGKNELFFKNEYSSIYK